MRAYPTHLSQKSPLTPHPNRNLNCPPHFLPHPRPTDPITPAHPGPSPPTNSQPIVPLSTPPVPASPGHHHFHAKNPMNQPVAPLLTLHARLPRPTSKTHRPMHASQGHHARLPVSCFLFPVSDRPFSAFRIQHSEFRQFHRSSFPIHRSPPFPIIPVMPTPHHAAQTLKALAREQGFDLVGISRAQSSPHADAYRHWIAAGKHGAMEYLAKNIDHRLDITQKFPWAKSILSVALAYWQPPRPPPKVAGTFHVPSPPPFPQPRPPPSPP